MTLTAEQILCCPRGCIMPVNECSAVARSDQTVGNGARLLSVLHQVSAADRLTLARAIAPDGWVVVKVPVSEVVEDANGGLFHENMHYQYGEERGRRMGWNACRAAMIASSEGTP